MVSSLEVRSEFAFYLLMARLPALEDCGTMILAARADLTASTGVFIFTRIHRACSFLYSRVCKHRAASASLRQRHDCRPPSPCVVVVHTSSSVSLNILGTASTTSSLSSSYEFHASVCTSSSAS